MLDRLCGVADRVEHAGLAREFCRDRRHERAVGRDVHRTRQGADPSALRQLPSGRRPSAPGRRAPAASAAGRARRRRSWHRRRCAARSATATPTSIPAACRAIRNGIWRRARWRGRARRSPRSARRSRIPRATAAARSEDLIHHIGEDTLVGWAWHPGFGRTPRAGHAEAGRRAGRGLGEDRRGLSGEVSRGQGGYADARR